MGRGSAAPRFSLEWTLSVRHGPFDTSTFQRAGVYGRLPTYPHLASGIGGHEPQKELDALRRLVDSPAQCSRGPLVRTARGLAIHAPGEAAMRVPRSE